MICQVTVYVLSGDGDVNKKHDHYFSNCWFFDLGYENKSCSSCFLELLRSHFYSFPWWILIGFNFLAGNQLLWPSVSQDRVYDGDVQKNIPIFSVMVTFLSPDMKTKVVQHVLILPLEPSNSFHHWFLSIFISLYFHSVGF